MDQRERAIEIVTRIKQLRSELEELESELDEMLRPLVVQAPRRRQRRMAASSNGNGGGINKRILKILTDSKNLLNAEDIHEEMPDIDTASIRAALSRMIAQRLVIRPERGYYTEAPAKPDEAEVEE